MTPLNTKGGYREMFVGTRLFEWADAHGGLVASSSAGFTLADDSVRSPDASWVSDALWNALTDAQQCSFAPVCPPFLVEILSESDSRKALKAKMEMWLANGAQLAWMIDPFAARSLSTAAANSPKRKPVPTGSKQMRSSQASVSKPRVFGQNSSPKIPFHDWRSTLLSWIIERSSVA